MVTISVQIWEGRGSLVASKNGTVIQTINPGDGLVSLIYNVGDSFYFQAYPDTTLGYSFNKFCGDAGCTITTTSNPFSGTVSTDGFLFVYFKGTPATVNVAVQNNVGGTVDVYRNTRKVATVSTSPQTVNFFINDTYGFQANPSTGYSFSKFCSDASCSQFTSTTNPMTGTITAATGSVYTFFTSGGGANGWTCVTTNTGKQCQQTCTTPGVGTCYSTQAQCTPTCTATAPTCKTEADCPPNNMCLSAIGLGCQPKMYVYGAVIGFFALMMLKKKKDY